MTIVSSWIVEDGFARPMGDPVRFSGARRCGACGNEGHNRRVCPMLGRTRQERHR